MTDAPLPPPPDPTPPAGPELAIPPSPIPVLDLVGTLALLVATLASWAVDDAATEILLLVVSGTLFVGGCIAFVYGFLVAVGRSRYETIHLAGLFYLTGTAPTVVRQSLMRLWFLQIGIAIAGLWITSPPWGAMAPLWGIGLLTLWGGRHGTFAPKPGVTPPAR